CGQNGHECRSGLMCTDFTHTRTLRRNGAPAETRPLAAVRGERFGEPIETGHDGEVNAMTAVGGGRRSDVGRHRGGGRHDPTLGPDRRRTLWPADHRAYRLSVALTAITTARVEPGVPGPEMSSWSG